MSRELFLVIIGTPSAVLVGVFIGLWLSGRTWQ